MEEKVKMGFLCEMRENIVEKEKLGGITVSNVVSIDFQK